MRHLFLIAASIISITLYGQDTLKEKSTTADFKRLLIGVNVSPDYCYRSLQNNNGSSTSSNIIDLRNKNEGPKFGYTAGLNVCYNISKLLGIEAGLQYSNKGFMNSLKNSELNFGDPIAPRNGIVYPNGGITILIPSKFIYNYIYLDIPVRAIFSFGRRRIQFLASAGLTTNILLKATQTNIFENVNGSNKRETNDQIYNFKSLNISPLISAGIDYRISNKINLRIEPTIRYGILKIIDTPVTAHLWNAGLNISCYYTFK